MENKILIKLLGVPCVGCTSICTRYTMNIFVENYHQCVIVDYYHKTVTIKDKKYELDIDDSTSTLNFYALTELMIKHSNIIVLVYSIDSKSSFNEMCTILNLVHKTLGVDTLRTIPAVICGNKNDLENKREVSYIEGQKLAEKEGCLFYEISALKNINLTEMFEKAVSCYVNTKSNEADQQYEICKLW
ncbi:hypothetical protein EIN_075710 [Entamoeba invadens IP1]|uniref:Uncharacterized protein n=1 Tax=Entamoeba invadens IP1 TaxID=370355 RepID=A0A0A1TWA4_ENTIV|nr:hypothetical protein EIN_075710 [Entamoeba invadens IP1]ELP84782.1 hypothetical protein EIN_075710 [Entamoeba invadens IP1]|eukprot:XP_004184128.1 hypothetical protein EIN_075710 [Entamoeba invadens IP1]